MDKIVEFEVQTNRLQIVGIELNDIYALQILPMHHRDSFDHLLLAQTTMRGMTLVTCDVAFQAYGAPTLW